MKKIQIIGIFAMIAFPIIVAVSVLVWLPPTTDDLLLSARVSAPRQQNEVCVSRGQVWDDNSHSCKTEMEIGDRRANEYGYRRIPGADSFRPGDHFWVSPTEVFGQLHEYVVTEDGSIADSTGIIVPVASALEYFTPVPGPDGSPLWFEIQVLQTSRGIFIYYNLAAGHAGWKRK